MVGWVCGFGCCRCVVIGLWNIVLGFLCWSFVNKWCVFGWRMCIDFYRWKFYCCVVLEIVFGMSGFDVFRYVRYCWLWNFMFVVLVCLEMRYCWYCWYVDESFCCVGLLLRVCCLLYGFWCFCGNSVFICVVMFWYCYLVLYLVLEFVRFFVGVGVIGRNYSVLIVFCSFFVDDWVEFSCWFCWCCFWCWSDWVCLDL